MNPNQTAPFRVNYILKYGRLTMARKQMLTRAGACALSHYSLRNRTRNVENYMEVTIGNR